MSEEQDSAWTSSGWTCPSCNAAMPDGAVICITCGYDKRTGRRINEPAPSRLGYTIATAVVAIVLALGVRAYFSRPTPVPTPPPHTAAVKPPAPAVAPPSNPAPVAAAAPALAAATSAPAIDTNELARAARAAMEQETAVKFRLELDARYPLYTPGESVALRMTNAIVRRGLFKGTVDGALVLTDPAKNEATIPFADLDVATRLRCDTEFRKWYLGHAIEKVLKAAK